MEHIEVGGNIDSLFLDFENAFDKVDHGLLCHRIKEKNINDFTGRWIADFLKNRHQYVLANGKLSTKEPITSGVPQGSVLGPILFLLIIDSIGDLDKRLTIGCFADDTKMFYSINSLEDASFFQDCIEKLNQWQIENNMTFNKGNSSYSTMVRTLTSDRSTTISHLISLPLSLHQLLLKILAYMSTMYATIQIMSTMCIKKPNSG